MVIKFLGQGYEAVSKDAVGNHLIDLLSQKQFHTFTAISAFASEAGIYGLSAHIQAAKENFKNLSIIVGIDQKGTSKEALEEILNLNVNSYIFYQKEAPIFHPKIYLFEGNKEIKLIVGSSNLTRTGLFINVESSLLIEFDINDEEGTALLTNLKTYYNTLFGFTDSNLFKLSSAVINDFNVRGIVPDEIERRRIYSNKKASASSNATSNINSINVPKRPIATIPSNFPRKPRAIATGATIQQSNIINTPVIIQPTVNVQSIPFIQQPRVLVWQKLSLSQSDAQQVPAGTAITGNLKLSQARFKINNKVIDQTIYFRYVVFNNLSWIQTKPNNASYEEAHCAFDFTFFSNPLGNNT